MARGGGKIRQCGKGLSKKRLKVPQRRRNFDPKIWSSNEGTLQEVTCRSTFHIHHFKANYREPLIESDQIMSS